MFQLEGDMKKNVYISYIKRLLDIVLSGLALIVLSPLMLIVAILVRIKLGSPIIFTQKRPGKNESIFSMYKFRTMTSEVDENGELLPDEVRLTKFGKLLRSTSLDELPELWNIFIGDLSIIGPRPLLVRDMVFMTDAQRKRHLVRPGLSGLAQVNGRNAISWEKKLSFDIEYISDITFISDLSLILQTVKKVFQRADITREGTDSDMDFGDYLLQNGNISLEEYRKKQEEAKNLLIRG